jgi:hypothetical protein
VRLHCGLTLASAAAAAAAATTTAAAHWARTLKLKQVKNE